mmetsp:Transcript_25115/g.45466  ORF Transcript_25115/g.45466 Transcript_25115/m.45466 type:complete len:211 (-) Transcript_25115:983-1615(-)
MNNELVFNRCRGHVFSLARLEEFLGATRNFEAVLGINFPPISSPEPSILRQGIFSFLWILVVPHHETGRLDLDLSIARNPMFDIIVRFSHRTGLGFSGSANVRIIKVFRHAVSLQKLETESVVPCNEFGRHGRRSGPGKSNAVQSESLEDFSLDKVAKYGNFKELVQFLGGHLLADAHLKLGPQTRDTEKERGFGAIEVLHKGGQTVGEE